MTWEIVVGLIALIGCAISLGGVLAKLVRTLTRLEVTISALESTLAELKSGNDAAHREMRAQLQNHEGRISKLEWRRLSNGEPRD